MHHARLFVIEQSTRATALMTGGIALACILLVSLDYWFVERGSWEEVPPTQQGSSVSNVVSSLESSSSSSSIALIKKGTKRKKVIDPRAVIERLGFEIRSTEEHTILLDLLSENPPTTVVLLKDNDRAALISWTQRGDVKSVLSSLKESLLHSFSPNVRDLIDTTTQASGPIVDTLSFLDPSLSTDRITFIRVRELLIELHVPVGSEERVQKLLEALHE